MKRIIPVILFLLLLLSCSLDSDASSSYEAELKDFRGTKTITLSHDSAEGDISWDILLDSGVLEVSYSSGISRNIPLINAEAGDRVVGHGGYRDGKIVKIHIKALEPVTGKVGFSIGL